MPLPRCLARFNRAVTNRLLGALPQRISPFLILHHIGRTSGCNYTVPLAGFVRNDQIILTPTYGPTADWVRNIIAADSFLVDRRGCLTCYRNVRLVAPSEAWPFMPHVVQTAMRILRVGEFILADEVRCQSRAARRRSPEAPEPPS